MSESSELADLLADYVPRADYEATLEALNELMQDRDAHAADSERYSARAAELETKHRARSIRDAYDKAAEKLRVDPRFRDAAFKLAELPSDEDEPDQSIVEKQLAAYLKDQGQHFVLPPESTKKTIPAGDGGGRGRSVAPGEPEFRVTDRQRNDALWMRDNQERFNAASKAGLLVMDDD